MKVSDIINKINGNYWKIKPRNRIQSKLNICVQQNNAEYNVIDEGLQKSIKNQE